MESLELTNGQVGEGRSNVSDFPERRECCKKPEAPTENSNHSGSAEELFDAASAFRKLDRRFKNEGLIKVDD